MPSAQPEAPCDPKIFEKGECIGTIHTYPSTQVEAFVRHAAHVSGQKIDWHYAGGRGQILTLAKSEEDKSAVIQAFFDLRLDPRCTDLVPENTPHPDGVPYMRL